MARGVVTKTVYWHKILVGTKHGLSLLFSEDAEFSYQNLRSNLKLLEGLIRDKTNCPSFFLALKHW